MQCTKRRMGSVTLTYNNVDKIHLIVQEFDLPFPSLLSIDAILLSSTQTNCQSSSQENIQHQYALSFVKHPLTHPPPSSLAYFHLESDFNTFVYFFCTSALVSIPWWFSLGLFNLKANKRETCRTRKEECENHFPISISQSTNSPITSLHYLPFLHP